MNVFFLILTIVLKLNSFQQALASVPTKGLTTKGLHEWMWIEHTVKSGETLRLISRQYFGHKLGAICLEDQILKENPNQLIKGESLFFLVPAQSVALDVYQTQNVKCAPGEVVVNGKNVTPEKSQRKSDG